MAESLPERFGRYALVKQLARGGMGEVFLARVVGAHGFEKKVAVKRILPQFATNERFRRMLIDEAKTTCFLNHPNIAQVLELGEVEKQLFLVMEYVPGRSLSELLRALRKQRDRLSTMEAVFIGMEMCQGLHAAHTQTDTAGRPLGIIHRDVSPQNLLISHDGIVKVIDFGIARARDRLETTEAGAVKGKVYYMAPEQLSPERLEGGEIDHRVDVFAVGVVLWEMLAGRRLFKGKDIFKVIEMVLEMPIPDLREYGVDDELAGIVKRALCRDRNRRWQDANKLAAALRGYLYSREPSFTAEVVAERIVEVFGVHETHDGFDINRSGTYDAAERSGSEGALNRRDDELTPSTPTGSFASANTATLRKPVPRPVTLEHKASEVRQVSAGAETRVLASSDIVMPRSSPHVHHHSGSAPAAPKKKRSVAPIAIAASVVLGLAVAGFAIFYLEKNNSVVEKAGTEIEVPVESEVEPTVEAKVEPQVIETPPPVEIKRARLRVQVEPKTAKITVDGEPYQPGAELVPERTVIVKASLEGHMSQEARVRLSPGVEHFVALTLAKKVVVEVPAKVTKPPEKVETPVVRPRGYGYLQVSTGAAWAEVYVDGRKQRDTTPMRVKLSAGRHSVKVINPITKKSKSFSVTIKNKRTVRRDVSL